MGRRAGAVGRLEDLRSDSWVGALGCRPAAVLCAGRRARCRRILDIETITRWSHHSVIVPRTVSGHDQRIACRTSAHRPRWHRLGPITTRSRSMRPSPWRGGSAASSAAGSRSECEEADHGPRPARWMWSSSRRYLRPDRGTAPAPRRVGRVVAGGERRVGGRTVNLDVADGVGHRRRRGVGRAGPGPRPRAHRRARPQDVQDLRRRQDDPLPQRQRGRPSRERSRRSDRSARGLRARWRTRSTQMASTVPIDAPWAAPNATEWDSMTLRAMAGRELAERRGQVRC